jgi:hypothetical protein
MAMPEIMSRDLNAYRTRWQLIFGQTAFTVSWLAGRGAVDALFRL